MSTGAELIRLERLRQQQVEGWTAEHDAKHDLAEMLAAAQGYIGAAGSTIVLGTPGSLAPVPLNWPWHLEWWKPASDPVRNLVKAGALIAAEIDRLQLLSPPDPEFDPSRPRGGR